MKRSARSQAGFTLLEIMLVVSIIALLATAAIVKLSGNVRSAEYARVDGDLMSISTQLQAYYGTTGGFPTTEQGLNALVTPPSPKPRRWIQFLTEIPKDPWGKDYMYKRPGTRSNVGYDLYSTGPTGPEKEDPSDDLGNWN